MALPRDYIMPARIYPPFSNQLAASASQSKIGGQSIQRVKKESTIFYSPNPPLLVENLLLNRLLEL
jgi:hypothetical protein